MQLCFAEISQVGFCYGSCWIGKLVPDLVATNHHLDIANSPPKRCNSRSRMLFLLVSLDVLFPNSPQIEKAGGLVVRDAHKVWRVGSGFLVLEFQFQSKVRRLI